MSLPEPFIGTPPRVATWRAMFQFAWSAEKLARSFERSMRKVTRTLEAPWLEQPTWRFKRFQTRWKPRRPYNWEVYGI